MEKKKYDAVVVGAGPNGLAAAITLAKEGYSVCVLEAKDTPGGGVRSKELTLPGFIHDVCSAVYPLGIGSPFFTKLPLSQYGLEWIQPSVPLAHPLDDGGAVLLDRSVEITAKNLGNDVNVYENLMRPLVNSWEAIKDDILGPLRWPSHPLKMLQFGFYGLKSAKSLISRFKEPRAKALMAGLAAHSILPLNKSGTAAFALVLGILAHKVGWPIARGGSQALTNALTAYLGSLGGKIETSIVLENVDQLPTSKIVLFDLTPKQIVQIVGDRLPANYTRRLRNYRYGPGIFKIDWALSQPIPWKSKSCLQAATVHVGGTFEEIALSEKEVWEGKHPAKNFVLLAQQSLFDPLRVPEGKQSAWAYCHVPSGSQKNMTASIEAQVERFAPGFRDCILARHTLCTTELEKYNANYIGGDIIGGVQDLFQLYTRPLVKINPYVMPVDGWYICSSSTPPGGGVHGMCGYHAARAAIENLASYQHPLKL